MDKVEIIAVKKTDWTRWALFLLVIACLVAVVFIWNYAHSEAYKCLQNPLTYAIEHNYTSGIFKINP